MRMRKKHNLEPRLAACSAFQVAAPEEKKGAWRSLKPDCREILSLKRCGNNVLLLVGEICNVGISI